MDILADIWKLSVCENYIFRYNETNLPSDFGARTADLTTTNTVMERYDADGAIYDTVQ